MQPSDLFDDDLVLNLERIPICADSNGSNLVQDDSLWDGGLWWDGAVHIDEDMELGTARQTDNTPKGPADDTPEGQTDDTPEDQTDDSLAFQRIIKTFGDVCTYAELMHRNSSQNAELVMCVDYLPAEVTREMLSAVARSNNLQISSYPALWEMMQVMQVPGKLQWYQDFDNIWDHQAFEAL